MSQVVIIAQARIGSNRLFGKVMKPALGEPLLAYFIERLERVTEADRVVIATTDSGQDDSIEALCQEKGVSCFRGSQEDVLQRYLGAAAQYGADVIVRVTADCCLIDPELINSVIRLYKSSNYDYVSNVVKRTFPKGQDVEVVRAKTLQSLLKEPLSAKDREHVTWYIRCHLEDYKTAILENPEDLSQYSMEVNFVEDYALVKEIIENLYPNNPEFNLQDVIQFLRRKHVG